jgi:ribosomal protein S18 acetylase RimI-like enzyme
MMNGREIRHYQPGDEQKIVEIYNSAFGSYAPFFPRTEESWLWRYVNRPNFDPKSVLIAEEGRLAVSSLVMTYAQIRVSEVPRKIALIDDVATLPEYRSRGHATALLKRAIEIATEKECYTIHLTANPKGSAIGIYEKLGFDVITELILMESILHIYGLTKAVGFRYYVPLLFLNSWTRLKEKRTCKLDFDIVSGEALRKAFHTCQRNYPSHNGFIHMDDEYFNWMIERRSIGKIIGLKATLKEKLVGCVSISVHSMESKNHTFKVGNIGNLMITDEYWTQRVLSEFLQTARHVSKDTLDCVLLSVATDARDTILVNACKKSRFYPLSHGAAMIHSLGNPDRLFEIKNQLWAQPLETLVADP